MIECQKHKFNLPKDVTYLNCANIAPLMNELVTLGKDALDLRQRPFEITRGDWFKPVREVKRNFAKMIQCADYRRIALIPSVSYGIATVAKNISLKSGDEIIVVDEQYPSNYYSWLNLSKQTGAEIKIVLAPTDSSNKGKEWNEKLLASISKNTRVVAIGNVHWTDGTFFNLEEIGKRARECNALLIIDGSQSIGALPFDISKIQPDALFCVGYKWLLGPFGLGISYFGDFFNHGAPLEENWINRKDSDNFQNLVAYTPEYRPMAGRYNVGQHSSFHLLPILNGAISQLNEWKIEEIQKYCTILTADPINELKNIGCKIEDENFRASHLLGIRFGNIKHLEKLQSVFIENKIYASLRGSAVRVSINVYNDENDMDKLVECIKKVV